MPKNLPWLLQGRIFLLFTNQDPPLWLPWMSMPTRKYFAELNPVSSDYLTILNKLLSKNEVWRLQLQMRAALLTVPHDHCRGPLFSFAGKKRNEHRTAHAYA